MSKKKILLIILILVAVGIVLALVLYSTSRLKIDGGGSENSVPYVYDEENETVTDPDTGLPYVYETDEDGDVVINENGEPATNVYGYEEHDTSSGAADETFPSAPINDPGESTQAESNGESTKASNSPVEPESEPEPNGDVIGIVTLPN